MILTSDNCNVEIDENQISCSYTVQFDKRINWKIHLDDKIYHIQEDRKTTFNPQKIEEFNFEIQSDIKRAHNLTQIAVAYVIEKGNPEPTELFRLCVRQEITLTSKSKSYQFAETILKAVSEKYSVPYRFKHSVLSRQKNKNFWFSVAIALFAMIGGLFLGLLRILSQ